MRKLILAALLAASICAYPQKHNYHIVYDTVEFKNWPSYTPKKINVSTEKLREALFCNTTTWVSTDFCSLLNYSSCRPRDDIHDTVNACADKLFEYVDQLLAEHLDPLSLPDMHTGFNYVSDNFHRHYTRLLKKIADSDYHLPWRTRLDKWQSRRLLEHTPRRWHRLQQGRPKSHSHFAHSFRRFGSKFPVISKVQSNFSKIFRSPTTTVPKLWVLDPLEESRVA